MLMDPYLSARSISTPCTLFALTGVLEFFSRRSSSRVQPLALCCSSLLLAGLVHPLMAAYALGCVLLLSCLLSSNPRVKAAGVAALSLFAVLAAALLYKTAPLETTPYLSVALTRTYWFVERWHWYERFGLVAPIAILATVALQRRYLPMRQPVVWLLPPRSQVLSLLSSRASLYEPVRQPICSRGSSHCVSFSSFTSS